ncbi:MAG: hypothetical protein ACI3ZY_07720 [Parabacteroides sp.]
MINLSTSNEIMWREFSEDYKKAKYWFYKKSGGDEGVYRLMVRSEQRSAATGQNDLAGLVEYTSKHGNHWLVCVFTFYLGGRPMPSVLCLAYYQTVGSYGAFVPIIDSQSKQHSSLIGMQIFTSHYLLRARDRFGLKLESKEDLIRAVTLTPDTVMRRSTDPETGQVTIDYQFPQGIARGFMRSSLPLILEIRTCLSQKELSNRQSRQKANVRLLKQLSGVDYGDKCEFPGESAEEQLGNARKAWILSGGSPVVFDLSQELIPILYAYFVDRLGVNLDDDKIWAAMHGHYMPRIEKFGDRWNEMDIEEKRKEVSWLIVDMARVANFSKVKYSEVLDYITEGTWCQYRGQH